MKFMTKKSTLLGHTYNVSLSTTNDYHQQCYPLSYYISNSTVYSNATFIFMVGEHLLDNESLAKVVIENFNSLTCTLRGYSNTDIIIRCSNNTSGLEFYKLLLTMVWSHYVRIIEDVLYAVGIYIVSIMQYLYTSAIHLSIFTEELSILLMKLTLLM